ncbi:MAG: GAF domain-containing protein [Candidatus Nanopelagicales bacterium]
MTFPKAVDDEARVEYLRSLGILDTPSSPVLDCIVDMCRDIFQVRVANISLVDSDRQWFKVIRGLDVCETPRDLAFCNYTILSTSVYEVPNALLHPELRTNSLVTGEPYIRYYAGAPLIHHGVTLGALCLIDFEPRAPLTPRESHILTGMASLVIREIEVQRLLGESNDPDPLRAGP